MNNQKTKKSVSSPEPMRNTSIIKLADYKRENEAFALDYESLLNARKADIKKGDTFSKHNLTVKRPGLGISPMRWNEIIGQAAQKDYQADDLI